jgi:GntR family transcriptional regulator / MocR family aminotransferase
VPADLEAVRVTARRLGVTVETLDAYHAGDRTRAGLVLGYGMIPAERIPEGLPLLRRAFDGELARPA